ncbi:carbohydrate sulfotransferase 3-like [Cherax quadricarinatus]|uniref:carbohydrate sulfotransferase 3-like n=1 Tax=Cherax quadricarinatus TaxID=27406 RepID=UPI00387E618D
MNQRWKRRLSTVLSLVCVFWCVDNLLKTDNGLRSATPGDTSDNYKRVLMSSLDISDKLTENIASLPSEVVRKNTTHCHLLNNRHQEDFISNQNVSKDSYELLNAPAAADNETYKSVENRHRYNLSILIMASVGRSGSTFLGELLASQGNNMYMFEPIRSLQKPYLKASVVAVLLNLFHCNIKQNFLELGKVPYTNIKHHYIKDKSKEQIVLHAVNEHCKMEPIRIIKTIRTRLQWTKQLLEDKDLNLKVIHLVRDPRGSFVSTLNLEWNLTTSNVCHKILQVRS